MSLKSKGPIDVNVQAGERQYEAWENLAPLDELDRDSVREVQKHCMELPLPPSLLAQANLTFNPVSDGNKTPDLYNRNITPSQLGLLGTLPGFQGNCLSLGASGNNSRSSPCLGLTSFSDDPSTVNSKFMPNKPIVSTSDFLLWFSSIEPNLIVGQDDSYRRYRHTLIGYEEKCDSLLKDLAKVKNCLKQFLNYHVLITEKTQVIRTACFDILKSQSNLERNLALIENQLKPFDQLSRIFYFLTQPGNDLCLHPSFNSTLQQIDDGITFLKEHINYKDARIYLSRYQQFMTRTLSMIHLYLSDRVLEIKTQLQKPKESSPIETELASGYQLFQNLASEIRSLILQLEERVTQNPDHENLLVDCYEIFLQTRGQLLKRFLSLYSFNEDLFTALVDGSKYMQNILHDEEALFKCFFTDGEKELQSHLDEVLSNFYEVWSDRLAKWLKSTFNSSSSNISKLSEANQILSSQKVTLESSYFKKTCQTIQNLLTLITSKIS